MDDRWLRRDHVTIVKTPWTKLPEKQTQNKVKNKDEW